jgi:eukaryotic-like serine/threonine-protein kinase
MNDTQQHSSLGQFRPLAQLGQGGMARVLLVSRSGPANIQKLLVIKEIREELANDAEFVTMFMDEARLATRMSHPNLVQTYDVAAEGQHYFMVMEYLEGQPMHAFLGRVKRKLPLGVHLRIFTRVLAGLQYAHELRGFDGTPMAVVHRDVSPQNTILCYDGQVKLVDFGIAKAAGGASRTTAGMFKGKLGYVAPEQVQGTDIDRRADIFSVGVMLWEALVGRRLTYGENEAAILHKRTTGTQARVLEARPEADAELARICDRAMELDPQKRFSSAQEMLEALDARIEALGIRTSDGEIGKLVETAFAEERRGILALIERQLALPARSAADASAVAKLPLLPTETGPTSIPPSQIFPAASGPWSAVSPSTPPPTISPNVVDAPMFRPSKRRVALVAGAGLAAATAITVVIATLAGGKTATSGKSGEMPTTSSVPTPTASATPSETTVDVTVEVVPSRAKIMVDGKNVGRSPFHTAVPRDSAAHPLVVSADGFAPETRSLAFDRDVRVEISLHPLPTNTAHFPINVAPTATATTSGGAGSDLQVSRPKRNIDEKDPY